MAESDKLVGTDGRPLIKEPKLIVVKRPRGMKLTPGLISGLANATGCNVAEIPLDADIMMGRTAYEELVSIHQAIHAILQITIPEFSEGELSALYNALKFLCDRTHPKASSPEVLLAKRLHALVSKEATND